MFLWTDIVKLNQCFLNKYYLMFLQWVLTLLKLYNELEYLSQVIDILYFLKLTSLSHFMHKKKASNDIDFWEVVTFKRAESGACRRPVACVHENLYTN